MAWDVEYTDEFQAWWADKLYDAYLTELEEEGLL
jgi:hypothetical protein